jgi:hypothetical protein
MIRGEENGNLNFKLDYHENSWEWVGEAEPSTP